ncbi:hypothetical protein ASO20_01315 [Mycoplasma sp. (ex Biomphalaria glabrata)]|uniref:hypothetical protein n=1 Tax=Mycoplasma sp. (ex Biomphalaria glabrata) TaxID=1749074 RepID=UPI00073A696F|nr:hypothetical protein [Mycoplasma sp. (ex Biomphalaria glabrata)]ALV23294.1 hypothetical protein ASO20_01315 [Mycoplasma sp. (ex Biomphalaria glabrata)]
MKLEALLWLTILGGITLILVSTYIALYVAFVNNKMSKKPINDQVVNDFYTEIKKDVDRRLEQISPNLKGIEDDANY